MKEQAQTRLKKLVFAARLFAALERDIVLITRCLSVTRRNIRANGYAFGAINAALFLAGCHGPAARTGQSADASGAPALATQTLTSSPAKPPLNIVAIDRSGSTAPVRDQQIALLTQAMREGKARGEQLAIWAVDKSAVAVMQPTKMDETFKISPVAVEELKTPPGNRSVRTRPALFWEKMADLYSSPNAPNGIVRILYCTDGDNDWAGEAKRLEEAATRLSQNPHVFVSLAGLKPDETEILQKQFAAFGERAKFANPANQNTVIKDWRKLGQ